MKQYIIYSLLFICFHSSYVNAQNKEELPTNVDKTNKTLDALMISKTFEFMAITAYPLSQSPKNLSGSNYSISFTPTEISSHLPFYGTGHGGMALKRDKGFRFKGTPKDFIVKQTERGYEVSALVTDENDVFSISLSVSNSRTATLSISTNNRSSMSFFGEVE